MQITLETPIEKLGYSAEFVPQSKSRNAGDKQPSLNWRITLFTPNAELVTDYTQGIGHMPKYKMRRATVASNSYERFVAENGKFDQLGKPLPAPAIADVIYSLVSDAQCVRHGQTFEEFAADLGYDEDSRKAEAIFNACRDTWASLIRLGADLDALDNLFQDF